MFQLKDAAVSSKMTIKQAKDLYEEFTPYFIADPMAIEELLVESDVRRPVRNHNYLDALKLTDLMYRGTSKSLCMLTGRGADGFLDSLRDSFTALLDRVKNAGGKVRILVLGPKNNAFQADLREKYPDTLKIAFGHTDKPDDVRHFIVSDERSVREETPHKELNDYDDAGMICADVYPQNTVKARLLTDEFDQHWERVTQPSSKTA